MGGLRSSMPFTHVTFLVGTLALVGIPPLAGFWSKDAILASALADGGALGWMLYVGGLLGAVLTGMYALRLYFARLPRRAGRTPRRPPTSTRTTARARGR